MILALSLAGCSERDQIRHYTVARMETSRETVSGAPSRMLGGMIAHDKVAWFFKLMGPQEEVDPLIEPMKEFLRTVHFSAAGRPEWTLLEGWKEVPSTSSFRFKTLSVPATAQPLEISVSELQIPDDADAFALSNFNRWRGQLGLAPVDSTQMESALERIECDGGVMLFVNLTGRADSPGMGTVASGSLVAPNATSRVPDRVAGERPKLPFRFQTPDGWTSGGGSSMSLAAFQVQRDSQSIAITFTPAGGDLVANINRWRGQIRLPPASDEEIKAASRTLTVDARPVVMVELINESATPPQAIFGAIFSDAQQTWFVKLTGDAGLAVSEKVKFEQLIQSIRFEG